MSSPTVSASFAYDALGRRVNRTVNGVTTSSQYDGLDAIRESGAGGDATYLRTLAIDEALTRTEAGTTLAYLSDILGSTVALTDPSGSPGTTYSYAPFGEASIAGTASPNSFQFTGRENDGTGLYYYRARYYDPVRSRFVSADPIGLSAIGMHVYAYAVNNPLGFLDPGGLDVTVTLYRGAGPFGHIGVGVNTSGPLQTWGHYPNERAVYQVPGQVVADALHKTENDILNTITIRTTADQDRKMLRIINRSRGDRWYKLWGRNCATFVEEVLRAGEVEAPDTINPAKLMEHLKQLYLPLSLPAFSD